MEAPHPILLDSAGRIEALLPADFLKIPAVLAVSGGRDSMFLLYTWWVFYRAGKTPRPVVFHFDHELRSESKADAEFVRKEAARFDFPVYLDRADVGRAAERTGLGIEGAARRLRYRALGRVLRKYPGSRAFTAHHASDYVESVLLQWVRGGGAGALSTLPLSGNVEGTDVVRPLVFLSGAEIASAVTEAGIPFVHDASNDSDEMLRNRIRRTVMPVLYEEGLNPVRLWANFHDVESPGPVQSPPEYLSLDRRLLAGAGRSAVKAAFDLAFRRLALSPCSSALVDALTSSVKAKGPAFRLRFETNEVMVWSATTGPVWILPRHSSLFQPFTVHSEDGVTRIGYAGRKQKFTLGTEDRFQAWEPGMRIHLSGGTRKIKDLFQEAALPPPVRRNLPILTRSGRVLRICLSFWEDLRDRCFSA